jgi:energy-coupling factor transporter ATP-binding protein EcfA2
MAFGNGRGKRSGRAMALLERFGVAHRASHLPRHLSGGEAQRVALAVSMANEPALLLTDELVAQLDNDTAARVAEQVLGEEFAVLFVTHFPELADLAERRYVLSERTVRGAMMESNAISAANLVMEVRDDSRHCSCVGVPPVCSRRRFESRRDGTQWKRKVDLAGAAGRACASNARIGRNRCRDDLQSQRARTLSGFVAAKSAWCTRRTTCCRF